MKSVNALNGRQLFCMKKTNLFKRVTQFFEQTSNAAAVVEYLVAILLRDALCVSDYSIKDLTDLIHKIFLTTEPNHTLRLHALYFKKFFSDKKWQTVIDRLFQNETDYHEYTKAACLYNELLEKRTLKKVKPSNYQFTIVSTFKDANGKKHAWTLRDTKEIPEGAVNEAAEVAELLTILTTLTIFQTASGTRRFVEYVKYKSESGKIDIEHVAEATQPKTEEFVQASATAPVQAPTPQSSSNSNSTPQKSTKSASSASNGAKKGKLTYDQLMDKAEAMYQLSQAAPPPEPKGCSAAANPATTEKPPAKKSVKKPQTIDSSYLRYGKSEEQIKKDREERDWNNRVNKERNKRGKGTTRKKKGKKKK